MAGMNQGSGGRGNTAVRIVPSGTPGGPVTLSVSGRLSLAEVSRFVTDLDNAVRGMRPSQLIVDLAGVEYFDNAAALMVNTFKHEAEASGLPVELVNLSDHARRIMGLVDGMVFREYRKPADREPTSPLERIGDRVRGLAGEFTAAMIFLGELVMALLSSLVDPRRIRWKDVAANVIRVGVQGLPIVGLISFLVGLIIAFMSSLQLKPLGGDIFVASLVGIAMVKELAPLMTAIIVAGRSGSAFAAEIGTMVINEEVDALMIMGFEPVQFLVVPRVLAAFIVVPLLTLYADVFGLVGGLVVGVLGLDLTVITYITQTGNSIALSDVMTGLVKSFVFAAIIAGIGCYQGFRVKRGAEGVGMVTTSAVVSAIFFIVLADSIFAVVFHYL